MTIKDTVGTFAAGVVSTASTVARHPVCSAARAAGLVKGATGASVDLVRSRLGGRSASAARDAGHDAGHDAGVPRQRSASDVRPVTPTAAPSAPSAPERDLPGPDVVARAVPDPDELPEPVVIEAMPEGEAGEAFHTEPKASSRDSEHGGQAGDREEAEGYLEEIPEEMSADSFGPADDAPVWTSETPADGVDGESVFDAEAAHAARSEADLLRRAAERNPE